MAVQLFRRPIHTARPPSGDELVPMRDITVPREYFSMPLVANLESNSNYTNVRQTTRLAGETPPNIYKIIINDPLIIDNIEGARTFSEMLANCTLAIWFSKYIPLTNGEVTTDLLNHFSEIILQTRIVVSRASNPTLHEVGEAMYGLMSVDHFFTESDFALSLNPGGIREADLHGINFGNNFGQRPDGFIFENGNPSFVYGIDTETRPRDITSRSVHVRVGTLDPRASPVVGGERVFIDRDVTARRRVTLRPPNFADYDGDFLRANQMTTSPYTSSHLRELELNRRSFQGFMTPRSESMGYYGTAAAGTTSISTQGAPTVSVTNPHMVSSGQINVEGMIDLVKHLDTSTRPMESVMGKQVTSETPKGEISVALLLEYLKRELKVETNVEVNGEEIKVTTRLKLGNEIISEDSDFAEIEISRE